MKPWQKIALWCAGVFVMGVSAANLFFLLHDHDWSSHPSSEKAGDKPKTPVAAVPPSPTLPKTADWKRYDFPEAGFSALLPAPPETKTEKPNSPGDPDETTDALKFSIHAALADADYRIIASDIPKGIKVDLDDMHALINPGHGVQMIHRKIIGTGSSRAYDMTFKSPDGNLLRVRVFLLWGKFFQMVASAPEDRLNAKETDDFFESIEQSLR